MSSEHREFRCFGPPGTGKTTWLSRQIVKASEERGPHRVLACSFTKAAVSELNSRNLPLPPQNLGTLHALCYRGLEYPEIAEDSKRFAEFSEAYPHFKMEEGTRSGVDDGYSRSSRNGLVPGDVYLQLYSQYRALKRPKSAYNSELKLFVRFWEDFKKQTGTMDFTDLILMGLEHMDNPVGLPEVGFFDECQDFTPIEWDLVRKWGNRMETFVVSGDDDQLLYSFKGARSDVMLSPLPQENIRTLKQSYRVPRAIHVLAEKWIKRIEAGRRQPKEYHPREEEGQVIKSLQTFQTPEPLVRLAQQYAQEGKSCLFLASCGYMLNRLLSELRDRGIPFSNPLRRSNRAWNPLYRLRDQTSSLERCVSFNRFRDHWDLTWTLQEFETWISLTSGVKQRGWRRHVNDLGLEDEIPPDRLPLILKANMDEVFDRHLEWLADNVKGPAKKSVEFAAKIINNPENTMESLSQEPLIRVGTIHSVKGGEADVVFLFPDVSVQALKGSVNSKEGWESVIRQFYVGMTRARHILYVCSASQLKLSVSLL